MKKAAVRSMMMTVVSVVVRKKAAVKMRKKGHQ